MEGKTFSSPAVAGELESNFIEARLHADIGAYAKRAQELRDEFTDSVALPIFVVIDPATGEIGGEIAGFQLPGTFSAFLEESRTNLGL